MRGRIVEPKQEPRSRALVTAARSVVALIRTGGAVPSALQAHQTRGTEQHPARAFEARGTR